MPDKTLICKDCNSEFTFTESEQAFYKEKGFENQPPTRCDYCNRARKQQRTDPRGGFGESGRGFGGSGER